MSEYIRMTKAQPDDHEYRWNWKPGWMMLAGLAALAVVAILPAICGAIAGLLAIGPYSDMPPLSAGDFLHVISHSLLLPSAGFIKLLANTVLLSAMKVLMILPFSSILAFGPVLFIVLLRPIARRQFSQAKSNIFTCAAFLLLGAVIGLPLNAAIALPAFPDINRETWMGILAGSVTFCIAALILASAALLTLSASRGRVIDSIFLMMPVSFVLISVIAFFRDADVSLRDLGSSPYPAILIFLAVYVLALGAIALFRRNKDSGPAAVIPKGKYS